METMKTVSSIIGIIFMCLGVLVICGNIWIMYTNIRGDHGDRWRSHIMLLSTILGCMGYRIYVFKRPFEIPIVLLIVIIGIGLDFGLPFLEKYLIERKKRKTI